MGINVQGAPIVSARSCHRSGREDIAKRPTQGWQKAKWVLVVSVDFFPLSLLIEDVIWRM